MKKEKEMKVFGYQQVYVVCDSKKTAGELLGATTREARELTSMNNLHRAMLEIGKEHPFIPFREQHLSVKHKELSDFYDLIGFTFIDTSLFVNEKYGLSYLMVGHKGGVEVVNVSKGFDFDPKVKVGNYVIPQPQLRTLRVVLEIQVATNESGSDEKIEEKVMEAIESGLNSRSIISNIQEFAVESYEEVSRKTGEYKSRKFHESRMRK
jgi:hypothetical protein